MDRPEWAIGLLMPEDLALKERDAIITAEQSIRGMFMASTVECLRRAQGNDAATKAVADAGFPDASWGAMRKVPLSDFNRLRTVVAQALLPELGSYEAAVARIAAACVEIFFESVAGRTMMLLAGKDPHRLLGAEPNGYGLAVDDGSKHHYQKTGETSGTFTFAPDYLGPCHHVGVFTAAVQTVCGKAIAVKVAQTSLIEFSFEISW